MRPGARLNVVSVHRWDDDAVHAAAHQARVERDGSLRHSVVSFGGGVVFGVELRLGEHVLRRRIVRIGRGEVAGEGRDFGRILFADAEIGTDLRRPS